MRKLRAWAYFGLALALLSLALFAPHAWATPDNQGTVPSPTRPIPITPTSIVPNSRPRAAPAPTSTPEPAPQPSPSPSSETTPNAEQTSTATPTPANPTPDQFAAITASPGITNALRLTLVVDPALARPGATMHFTATLSNQGSEPIVSIAMTQTLSSGLIPGRLPVGSPARWQGQALHVLIASLAPGEQFVLPFSAGVPRTAKLGAVLQTVGAATGFGGAQAWLQTLLPLPPRELPRTGAPRARNP